MKGRVLLIHWHETEAQERAEPLRAAGWEVDVESADGAAAAQRAQAAPPDAVVVSLARLPSHGRETARFLREHSSQGELPIVFVDGDPETVAEVRSRVPDTAATSAEELPKVLQALRRS